ncbi:predicted protein [Naegleria gruberi]|uniref:threonine--tRNA ligase n=1 Tax=Naegleria gruberi TaxID=5762 RepID=D2VT77_NAEGR|nr:uncharacterized protein NAEGRDRAFT_60851 [Naegleria gruberi]EFC40098.1 predicted protein [Naegleria gruberi]|eukprot:XP_002672842.1 predicted protein [Naegleria gruberi strain NEG-M]
MTNSISTQRYFSLSNKQQQAFEERSKHWNELKQQENIKPNNINISNLNLVLKFGEKSKPLSIVVDSEFLKKTPLQLANEVFYKNEVSEFLVCKINGKLTDMNDTFSEILNNQESNNNNIEFFTFESVEGKEVFWHSTAHILGCALEQKFGSSLKLCDGPPLVSKEASQVLNGGFFYEGFLENNERITTEQLEELEKFMQQVVKEKHSFQKIHITKELAREIFKYNQFKLDIIEKIPSGEPITMYKCGNLVDLCRGPHIPNTSMIKAVKLTKLSGAYWKGDEKSPLLQRVYGISFPKAKQLEDWQTLIEEALKRDHRLIAKKQDLFFFHEYSPGTPFFLPHGTRLFNKLVEFIRKEYRKRGYDEVITPQMFQKELWETSGHWQHYKDDMFTVIEGTQHKEETIGIKPMNCPAHCLMFDSKIRSYRELPVRLADFSPLHRNEPRGSLTGLTRVRRFHQDDSHIFCTHDQVKSEIENCLQFVKFVYSEIFGFNLRFNLSTRPEKFVGDIEMWDKAEQSLKECLDGYNWKLNEGDGAFYGPKIDIQIEDSLQRFHQCATIQLDFQLPRRFNLKYQSQNDQLITPVIIHRAILGSIERFIALLTEHLSGRWPFWLNPRQCFICPVSAENASLVDYCKEVKDQIFKTAEERGVFSNYFIDVDLSDKTMKKKIRDAQVLQYNFILVLGEKEMQEKTVSVRKRDGTLVGTMKIDALLSMWEELLRTYQ